MLDTVSSKNKTNEPLTPTSYIMVYWPFGLQMDCQPVQNWATSLRECVAASIVQVG